MIFNKLTLVSFVGAVLATDALLTNPLKTGGTTKVNPSG